MDTNVGRPRRERKARRLGPRSEDAGDHDRKPNNTTACRGRNKGETTWQTKMISPWWKPTASPNNIDGHGFSYARIDEQAADDGPPKDCTAAGNSI